MRPAVVLTPLRVEHRALGRMLGGAAVLRTGAGPRRSGAVAAALGGQRRPVGVLPSTADHSVQDRHVLAARHAEHGNAEHGNAEHGSARPVLVAGVAGALGPDVKPGEIVVADEIRADGRVPVTVPTARPLAASLRALGLTVHVGPVHSAPRPVVGRAARERLARTGAIAVDTESAWLAEAAGGGPVAVVRAAVDTPDAPLLHPGTVVRGTRALRALRTARPALEQWVRATGERTVVLAEPRSFCAGVDRAIDTVERALDRHGAPVYVRRHIVHNTHVVRRLAERGAVFVEEADEVPPGAVLVLAAHGVSPTVRERAHDHDRRVVDATCPLVTKVHAGVRRHAARGATVFLIGHAEHEEVEGTVGEAPDRTTVVASEQEAEVVTALDPEKVAYAVQTTLAVDEAERIATVLQRRFPALVGPRRDDICYATTNRQRAVREVAAGADHVLVVGSPTSSNSVRLAEVATRAGTPATLLDDVADLDLRALAGATRIGVTAGASAPEHLVDELVAVLRGLGPVTLDSRRTTTEDVRFTLPKEVS